jgi:hypothetical protein
MGGRMSHGCAQSRRRSPVHTWLLRHDPTRIECQRCQAIVYPWEGGYRELAQGARVEGALRGVM